MKSQNIYRKTIEFKEGVPPIILELTRYRRGINVLATVYLPADSLGELHPYLRRSDIAVEWLFLDHDWGSPCNIGEQPYRYIRHVSSANTWAEAERSAMEWLFITILPLLVDLGGRSPEVARSIYRTTNPQSLWKIL